MHRGEILGIAGLIGSGRTRLLRTIFGLEPVAAGRVRVGVASGPASPRRRWQQGVGMLSEDRKDEGLALGLDVGDNLTMTRLEPFGRAGLVSPARQASAARRWIEQLDIKCAGPGPAAVGAVGRQPAENRDGRLLHHDVDVLCSTSRRAAIDVGSKAQIYRLDRRARRRRPRRGRQGAS